MRNMTIASFGITLHGHCCRRHRVSRRVVTDISIVRSCCHMRSCSLCSESNNTNSALVVFARFILLHITNITWPTTWRRVLGDLRIWWRHCTLSITCGEYYIRRCTKRSATAEIARDADDVDFSVDDVHNALTLARASQTDGIAEPWNGYSRSLEVIRCCANRRGIYGFLWARNSNLTSIFNRSCDIAA